MKEEIVYMVGVVAVGFLVNYSIRALPFVLFAGKNRELPRWVEPVGRVVSPVIIAGLIVYSFATLTLGPEKTPAWKTIWPYLAGVITVALQLVRRNPLLSIVTGTVLYMGCLTMTGCASRPPLVLDSQNPSVSVSTLGIKIGSNLVHPQEVVEALEDNDIPKTRVVHILLEPEVADMRPARQLMAYLCAAGYSRPVLVTKRHGDAQVVKKPRMGTVSTRSVNRNVKKAPSRQTIRYKSANE